MKATVRKSLLFILCAALLCPALMAQQGEKEKSKTKDKKDTEQIIITRTGDNKEKVVIEVNGDNVIVNGKPLDEYQGDDVKIHRSKIKDVWAYGGNGRTPFAYTPGQNVRMFSIDSNRAMLGVTTEKNEKGAEIESINEKSAAAKAGLKEGDIIIRVDDTKVENPDDLSRAIKARKPGDKVTVTYIRDKKEQKATAELTRWEGAHIFSSTSPGHDFNFDFDMENLKLAEIMPKLRELPHTEVYGNALAYARGPRLGISVQDTEDGKGVNVIDVDSDGTGGKAGIKEGDVITEVDGKAVNSADEVAKIIRGSKDKASVSFKLKRDGKTQTVDVKIPRKLKKADL